MLQEVPLITKKSSQKSVEFEVCKEGLALLRTLRTKKLRIIFNITHQQNSLSQFNGWLFGSDQAYQDEKVSENICLTISKHYRQLEDERIILNFNAYQGHLDEPFMVLLGYLASSVFLYHSSQGLSENSPLTRMLQGLKVLLANTDINKLNREMTFKKGYSKFPHFLCLLPINSAKQDGDPFKEFYRYREGHNENFNEAVDALIDFLPERSSLAQQINKAQVNKIGIQFEQNVLGREIFNFQFTGSTMENLCFECCEIFNSKASLNLSLIYAKIIENQKCRLEDEAYQYYLREISIAFFNKGKIDFEGHNIFPINSSDFHQRHREISEKILNQTLKLATYCMNLTQYLKIHDSLQKRFNEMEAQLQSVNHQKIEELCRQCFGLLQNIDECEINSASLNDLFREITNKLELFISECSQAFGNDNSFKVFTNYLNRLQSTILEKFRANSVQAFQDYQLKIQEYRVQREDLKYNIRVLQNKLRQLQYEYNLQEDILNQYKLKLIHEPEPVMQQSYSSQLNKFRKRIQQLQEEGQDKNLYIQQLEGIIERFEGLSARDRLKYKFSKEIAEMIKEVSNDVTNCHSFIKQAKKTNELHEQIKEGFAKERQLIGQERRKALQEFSHKQAELLKIIKEKRYLQQVIDEAKQSIQVYKQVDQNYIQSISHLQNTYTQAQCLLAETQNQLELFKKAISLISQQQIKGTKSQALNKFYKVSTNPQLKELLKPFLRK